MLHWIRGMIGDKLTPNRKDDDLLWMVASFIQEFFLGKFFNLLSVVLGFMALVGCGTIVALKFQEPAKMMVCGIIWILPFAAIIIGIEAVKFGVFAFVGNVLSGFWRKARRR
jgi:hypothetical protein